MQKTPSPSSRRPRIRANAYTAREALRAAMFFVQFVLAPAFLCAVVAALVLVVYVQISFDALPILQKISPGIAGLAAAMHPQAIAINAIAAILATLFTLVFAVLGFRNYQSAPGRHSFAVPLRGNTRAFRP